MNNTWIRLESRYLCSACGSLLYYEPKGEDPADVCLNHACSAFPADVVVLSNLEPAKAELAGIEAAIQAELRAFDPVAVTAYFYERRRAAAKLFLERGPMMVRPWHACCEVLLMLNRVRPLGIKRTDAELERLYVAALDWWRLVDGCFDAKGGIMKLGRAGESLIPYHLKYALVLDQIARSRGIVSVQAPLPDDVPEREEYKAIADRVTPVVALHDIDDLADYFDGLWPGVLGLRMMLRPNPRAEAHYRYVLHPIDMSVLVWLMMGLPKERTTILSEPNFVASLVRRFAKYSTPDRSTKDFLDQYVDSEELVPVVVRSPAGLLVDPYTLAVIILYLHGQPRDDEASGPGATSVDAMKQRTGPEFEKLLRKTVFDKGYTGPDGPVKIQDGGRDYEYDVVAVSEEKKRVVVLEAKFRDPPPSSFAADTLLSQELPWLQKQAEKHCKRVEFFRANPDRFTQYLEPKLPWKEYDVVGYLVSKHEPLAHCYRDIEIVSFDALCDAEKL